MPTIKNIEKSLPQFELIKNSRGEQDNYGAAHFIEMLTGIGKSHETVINWRHGWSYYPNTKYRENLIIGNLDDLNIIATKKQQFFLKEHGVDSIALGYPFIYVNKYDDKKIDRIPNSLLIMPPHSVPHTDHNFDESLYINEILKIKDYFDFIAVCIHSSCYKKGLWVNSFKKAGIPIITGANADDKFGLVRMNRIFKHFEYMTTNIIGSHVLYAAYTGCKVSIYGTYQTYSKQDFVDDPILKRFPFLLDHNFEQNEYKNIVKTFPFLFTQPQLATQNIEWAEKEAGKENMIPIKYLATFLRGSDDFSQHCELQTRQYKNLIKNKDKEISILKENIIQLESNKWYDFGQMGLKSKVFFSIKHLFKKIRFSRKNFK